MNVDYQSISEQAHCIDSMLNRINGLLKLINAGFDFDLPKLVVHVSSGNTFSGFFVAYESSAVLVLRSLRDASRISRKQRANGTADKVYIQAHTIVAMTIFDIEKYPLLNNLNSELPFSESVNRIQLIRELAKFQKAIEVSTGKSIPFSVDQDLSADDIPALFNMAKLIQQALIRTGYDALGRQAISDAISAICLENNNNPQLDLTNGILKYTARHSCQQNQLSVADAVPIQALICVT